MDDSYLSELDALEDEDLKLLEQRIPSLYGPRMPLTDKDLPEIYRVSEGNPEPSLVHFGIPLNRDSVTKFAKLNFTFHGDGWFASDGLIKPIVLPNIVLPNIAKLLTEDLNYTISICFPYRPTRDCDYILEFYSNKTMYKKDQLKEDPEFEEYVINYLRAAFGLDASVVPKWYFDVDDPWVPS